MNIDIELLDKIKNIKIRYKKEVIDIKSFEELILKSFFNILDNKYKKVLFIGVEKYLMTILSVLLVSVKNSYKNMKDIDNNILDFIEQGDKVTYKGKVFIYDKIDTLNNKKYINLYKVHNVTDKIYVPLENVHFLTLYNGDANRINKVSGKIQSCNITKKFIAEIVNSDISKLNGIIKESTIIVFPDKAKLYDLINSIEIKFGDDYYGISELFPFSYHSSEEKYEYFKGNRIKQNSIIKFVSNINTALDIIKEDEDVRNIITIGEKSYSNSLETELREINMIDSINKILIIETWESKFDFSLLINDDEPFNVYAISKEVILENVNLYDKSLINVKSSLQMKNYDLINNLINKNIEIYEVDNSEVINTNIYNINEELKVLSNYSIENIKILDFIKLSYYLCNKLEQSILPLNKCAENYKKLIEKICFLKEILNIFPKERVEYKTMINIISNIEGIMDFLHNENHKIEIIKKNILNKNKTILCIKNSDEFINLKDYFKRIIKPNLEIKKIDKQLNIYKNKSLIIPGIFNNNYINILNTNLIENINIVVYRREKIKIKGLIRKNNEMLKLILINNKLRENDEFDLLSINEHFLIKSNLNINKTLEIKQEEFNELEKEVQKAINENKIKIFIDKDKSNRNTSTSITRAYRIINFEDDNYAFLSENYQANIIDRRNNDIKHRSIMELNIEDEMIFTKSKLDGEEDIVKIVIKQLLKDEEFNNEYGEYFKLNNLWKNSLKKYMNIYNLTEKDISNELRIFGRKLNPLTIINWLNGNIIGPRDVNDIRIIANIVNDRELNKNLEQVIIGCKQERSIQIQIRKVIADIIINSIVKDNEYDEKIYKIIKSVITDLDKYAYIGKIFSIENINEELSSQNINKIIERDE